MKKFKFLISFIVVFLFLFFLTSQALAADLTVTCDGSSCEMTPFPGDPLFEETNWLPGDSVTRSITIDNTENPDDCNLIMDTYNETQTPPDFATKLFTEIREGMMVIYGGGGITLDNLYGFGPLELGVIPAGGSRVFDWLVTFDLLAGNEYQNAETVFDFDLHFACGEVPEPLDLELTKSNSPSGSVVTYTLSLHNASETTAYNVYLRDQLPSGFSYNSGTTEIDGFSSTDPTVADELLTWALGDIPAGDTVVVEYEATISDDLPDGTYPNVAVAWGNNLSPEDPETEITYSNFAFSGIQLTSGVSTSVQIPSVLGAAISKVLGAATGTNSFWLGLALMMLLIGLVLWLPKKRRAMLLRKLASFGKKLGVLMTIIIAFFVFARPAWAIESLYVRVVELPGRIRIDDFKFYYNALEREGKPISVDCYIKKDGGFDWRTFGSSQNDPSGFCQVVSADFDGDATYYFKAIATSPDGSSESNQTSTVLDRTSPGEPKDYQKARKSSMTYEIHWRNPDDADYEFTRVFASTEQNFTANDSTKLEDIYGSPGQEFDHVFGGFDPNKEYFFALQGFDSAGNYSGLVGDGGTVVYEETVLPVSETEAGETVVLPAGEGQILGGQAISDEEGLVGEAQEEKGLLTELAEEGKNRWWLFGLGGLAGLALGLYVFYRRRQRS